MSEHAIQNAIRNALAGKALIFRANIGQGWTSSEKPLKARHYMTVSLAPGDVVLRDARPFSTGLPPGFSDLFGLVPVVITPDMVGQQVAVFTALEVKTAKGKPTEKQAAFIKAVNDNGGRADVVRSPEDAVRVVEGGK